MRKNRMRGLRLALAFCLAALVCSITVPAQAKDVVAFRITDDRITESSGLTRDTTRDLYWTVNDSGDSGVVYALNSDGDVEGTLNFRADVSDIEAVAMVGNQLYVADIGDNSRDRDFVTVYLFDNPTPDNLTVQYRAFDFSYPDGPHDAETLLVDAQGQIYVVSKEKDGGIYAAPPQPSRQGVNVLTRVADAPAYVTDGVMLSDDAHIALRTYVSIEILDALDYSSVARSATPFQKQGESIALSLDGKSLLLGSEGKNSAVLSVDIPDSVEKAPSARATPPPSPTPTPRPTSASPSQQSAPDEEMVESSAGKSRSGTAVAIGLAALVSVIAGVVVAFARNSPRT